MEKTYRVNSDIILTQRTDGLMYGTDALLLAAFVAPGRGGRAVELGAGTGIISLMCAKRGKFAHITAVEVQDEYARLTASNIEKNAMNDRVSVLGADLRTLRASDFGGEVDAVFSNPPYMQTTTGPRNENDGKYAARHEVYGGIGDFCACAARLLRHGGSAYFVWRPDRLTDLFLSMRENKIEPKRVIFVYPDEAHPPCLVLCEGRKGGGRGLTSTPPLFVKKDGEDSDAIKHIYEKGEMPDGYRKK